KNKSDAFLLGYDTRAYIEENPAVYGTYSELRDFFVPVSIEFRHCFLELVCPSEKIKLLYPAIDFEKFTFKDRVLSKNGFVHLICACRFVEKKGIEYSIISMSKLVKKYPNIRYTIIGGCPLENFYRYKIRKLGLSKYIQIINWLPHEQLIKVLDRSHIFI